ncbi:TPA: hypothetical protein U2B72_000061 [Streptococcus suis]|nr:hypothetical protein [Streptococcus suis]
MNHLVASSRLAFSTLKRTITDTTVNLRKPYGRITDKIPVNFVHARTTNDFEHLIDATGDRRFLPVGTLPRKVGQPIKITKEDIVNIWGNYYRSYLNNSKLFYDNDSFEGKLIEKVRRRFKPHDEINEKVAWYLECEIPNNFYSCKISDKERRHFYKDIEQKGKYSKNQKWEVLVPRTKVSMNHLVNELFDEGLDSGTKQQIRTYLNHLENWEKRDSIAFSKSCNTSGWTNIKK